MALQQVQVGINKVDRPLSPESIWASCNLASGDHFRTCFQTPLTRSKSDRTHI